MEKMQGIFINPRDSENREDIKTPYHPKMLSNFKNVICQFLYT